MFVKRYTLIRCSYKQLRGLNRYGVYLKINRIHFVIDKYVACRGGPRIVRLGIKIKRGKKFLYSKILIIGLYNITY